MKKRSRLLISFSVQGPLMVRLATHLATITAAMATVVMIIWMFQGDSSRTPDQKYTDFLYRFAPLAGAGFALLPFIVLDMLRITNRVAGPLYRFEQLMKQFEETGELPPARLREHDLLGEFCNRFNRFVDVMHERYPECRPGSPQAHSVQDHSLAIEVVDATPVAEPVLS